MEGIWDPPAGNLAMGLLYDFHAVELIKHVKSLTIGQDQFSLMSLRKRIPIC